jgi:hypothetical protein
MIPNPQYQGKWAPKKIPNPHYFKDDNPFRMSTIVRFILSNGLLKICLADKARSWNDEFSMHAVSLFKPRTFLQLILLYRLPLELNCGLCHRLFYSTILS